jgi:hypothetical protein
MNYLGNAVMLPSLVNDENWVRAVRLEDHKADMAGSYSFVGNLLWVYT